MEWSVSECLGSLRWRLPLKALRVLCRLLDREDVL